MSKNKRHYFGTEIDGKWWKRYTKNKLFARGAGEYWYDDNSFNFRRYLTQTPRVFHYQDIVESRLPMSLHSHFIDLTPLPLASKRQVWRALDPRLPKDGKKNSRWKLVENCEPQADVSA